MSLTQWVTSPDSKHSPSSAFRRKRIALLLHLIEKIHRRYGFVTILDVGGRRNYWNCVNLDFLTAEERARLPSAQAGLPPGARIAADLGAERIYDLGPPAGP